MTPFTRATAAVLAEIACGEENARHVARAVLQAIREPSEGMCEAGGRIDAGLSSGRATEAYERTATEIWQTMIDKAMEGE